MATKPMNLNAGLEGLQTLVKTKGTILDRWLADKQEWAPIALRVPLGVIFLRSWRAENVRLVWRLRLASNDAVLHSIASHSGAACSGRNSGRAFGRTCATRGRFHSLDSDPRTRHSFKWVVE
jgi:hypothetical protein